jgi:hypothetical protein
VPEIREIELNPHDSNKHSKPPVDNSEIIRAEMTIATTLVKIRMLSGTTHAVEQPRFEKLRALLR